MERVAPILNVELMAEVASTQAIPGFIHFLRNWSQSFVQAVELLAEVVVAGQTSSLKMLCYNMARIMLS